MCKYQENILNLLNEQPSKGFSIHEIVDFLESSRSKRDNHQKNVQNIQRIVLKLVKKGTIKIQWMLNRRKEWKAFYGI